MKKPTAAEIRRRLIARRREEAAEAKAVIFDADSRTYPWIVIGSVTGFALTGNAMMQARVAEQLDTFLLEALWYGAVAFLVATAAGFLFILSAFAAGKLRMQAATLEADILEGLEPADDDDQTTSPALRRKLADLRAWGNVAGLCFFVGLLAMFVGMAIPLTEMSDTVAFERKRLLEPEAALVGPSAPG